MTPTTDADLLHDYATTRSQAAFGELVARHVDSVYAACRRQVRDAHLADDVTQAVFVILARKAAALAHHAELTGWLLKTARYASLSALREADRRKRHEHKAAAMAPTITTPADDLAAPAWERIAPELDAALSRLNDGDRSAIVLRYMKDRPHREIAAALSISEDAARQRVTRALARLRKLLFGRGLTLSGDAIAAALPLAVMSRAPLELVHTVAALGATASVTSASVAIVNGATRLMHLARAKAMAAAVTVVLAMGLAVTVAAQHIVRGLPQPPAAAAPPTVTGLVANTAGPIAAPASPAVASLTSQLVDALGRPVSNAYILADGASMLNSSPRTDARGRFTLKGVGAGQTNFVAYSQRSRRYGLFSVTPEGDLPATVSLDWTEASADGCVVDVAGNPIAGVTVRLFVSTPDGVQYHFQTSRTDRTGRYQVGLPTGTGLTLVASPTASPSDADATPPMALDRRYQVEVPDIVMKSRRGTPNPAAKRQRYSGRVVDEQGNGIPGVEIEMNYSKNHMSYTAGDVLTDAEGRFSRLMPADDLLDLRFGLTHADFIGSQFSRDVNTPPADALLSGKAVVVMKRGLALSGIVRDPIGKPIENALVLAASGYATTGGDSEPIEDFTSPRTDKDGKFAATGLPPGPREIMVSAEGFAPKMQSVDVSADAKPVEVSLDTGTTYTARIVDEDGQPLAGAHVSCGGWEAKPLQPGQFQDRRPLVRLAKADADGRFTLNNLPHEGKLQLYAGGPDRGERAGVEFDWSDTGKKLDTIPLYRYPVIEGKVEDAETSATVRKFKVATGWDTGTGFSPLEFSYSKTVNPGDGSFSKRIDGFITSVEDKTKYYLQISADGYAPTLTPPVLLGEKHGPFTVQLRRVQPVSGVVTDAAGKPVEGAEAILARPKQPVYITNGRLNDQFGGAPDVRMKTNADGRFSLSGDRLQARLIVLHPERGYALLDPAAMKPDEAVRLTPWAKIEGTATKDGKPAHGVQVSVGTVGDGAMVNGVNIMFQMAATVDVDGHFIIEHVPAMPLNVVGIPPERAVTPKPGETISLQLGQ